MTAIDRLIEADHQSPKRIAVIGDAMQDVWLQGHLRPCQEDCLCFAEDSRLVTPGGAANAVRSLEHWPSKAQGFYPFGANPVKTRCLVDGKIIFRHDQEAGDYKITPGELIFAREHTLNRLHREHYDAVLISDYDKGFMDEQMIREIIAICASKSIPCVADAKRHPVVYAGAILKCNAEYADKHSTVIASPAIITTGPNFPAIYGCSQPFAPVPAANEPPDRPVVCRNHIGAGDCFAAHLTLALAHGLPLEEAAVIAHAAGRVYVQHLHSRPPWPHEIRKDLDPVGGKILASPQDAVLDALRQSISPRRIVFTNGVFRVPHAGHAWLLRWAKSQGDVLIVGINDDESAARLRHGQVVLPLAQRLEMLAGLECVDWIIPFTETDPCAIIGQLKPDVLVKGHEYTGGPVPGGEMVGDVRFAPASPYPGHSSDLIIRFREGGR